MGYNRAELTRAELTQADLTRGRVDPHSMYKVVEGHVPAINKDDYIQP